jgi:hypothetical protein
MLTKSTEFIPSKVVPTPQAASKTAACATAPRKGSGFSVDGFLQNFVPDCTFTRMIGDGGFAKVWRRELDDETQVAVTVTNDSLQPMVRVYNREKLALSKIDEHPGCIRIV